VIAVVQAAASLPHQKSVHGAGAAVEELVPCGRIWLELVGRRWFRLEVRGHESHVSLCEEGLLVLYSVV